MVRNLSIVAVLMTLILVGLVMHDHFSIPSKNLVIYYTSNLRGQIQPFSGTVLDRYYEKAGGLAFIKGFIEESSKKFNFKAENTILLDTGDALFGSAEASLTMGEVPLSLMGKASYDAMAIGNMEFEFGFDRLKYFIRKKEVPMLACNYREVTAAVGQTFTPGIIIEKAGTKIGIVGAGHGDLARNTRQDNIVNVEVSDIFASVTKTAALLKAKGAELIILVSHHPELDSYKNLKETFPDIDIIIGDLIGPYQSTTGLPMICQTAPNRGGGVGMIKIPYVGGKWDIAKGFQRIFAIDASVTKPDKDLVQEISRVESKIDTLLEEVITQSKGNFQRSYNDESSLGNLIADSIRDITGADIAFQNSGGIKAVLSEGAVSLRNLFDMLPFENTIVTVTLKGWQVENLVEESLSGKSGFLQASGINCTYSSSNPIGFRVIQIDVGEDPLEFDKEYSVAINDFMRSNDMDWPEFQNSTNEKIHGLLRESLEKYLRKKPFIEPILTKRFVDFEEMDETLRVQALSFELASLTSPVVHDGTSDSEYGRLVCDVIKSETKADFSLIPVSLLIRNREPLSAVTPGRVLSDFATNEGVKVLQITGKTLERIIAASISSATTPLCFAGFSIELQEGGKFKIFPWEGNFDENNIYKVAINEKFPTRHENFYDFTENKMTKFSSDIRRTFINGLRKTNGKVDLKRAIY